MRFISIVTSVIPVCLNLFSSGLLRAQVSDISIRADSGLYVYKTEDFDLSGYGSAENWNTAEWITIPQRSNGNVYETSFKILYSNTGIYCLYKCEDSILTATLQGDFLDLYNEDVVEAFFWTDENLPVYFEYEISPLNYELAILVPNRKGDFFGWQPWHYEGERKTRHATHVNKENDSVTSWTAEFFIPFALLKAMQNVPPETGTRWRANFYRIDYDNGMSTWAWKPIQKNFHDYLLFGTLLFQ